MSSPYFWCSGATHRNSSPFWHCGAMCFFFTGLGAVTVISVLYCGGEGRAGEAMLTTGAGTTMTTGAGGIGTTCGGTAVMTCTGTGRKQSSIVTPAALASFVFSRILQDAAVCGPENERASSRASHSWSTLPPPNEPPNAIVCALPPYPLKHGTVGIIGGVIAEATGIFGAAMFVIESLELSPLPTALPPVDVAVDVAFPPVAIWLWLCCCFCR